MDENKEVVLTKADETAKNPELTTEIDSIKID